MLFFKILGGALLLLAGILTAEGINRRGENVIEYLDAWITLIGETKRQIECYALPVTDILQRAGSDLLSRCGWNGEEPPRSFQTLLGGARGLSVPEGAERALAAFCEGIGKGYGERECALCTHTEERLSAERDALLRVRPQEKKKNTTLCMTAAAAAVILLL